MKDLRYGVHNALTAYKPTNILGKLFNCFSKCQTKEHLFDTNIVCYDLQVAYKDEKWLGSHGFAWYDIELFSFLDELIEKRFSNGEKDKILIRLGYDYHYGEYRYIGMFSDLANEIKEKYGKYLNVYQVWDEDGYNFLYDDKNIIVWERYWTMAWAKSQINQHWWKIYLLLPLPKLWKKIYGKQWEKEFSEVTNTNIWMTDFV